MALKYLLAGQMRFMQSHGFEVIMISADGKELQEVIENEQCRHIIVPMTRRITPIRDLQCLFQLIRIFRKERPDIVHTHTPKAGLLGMIAAKISGVPIRIHTVAGLPVMVEKGFKRHMLVFTERLTSYAASQVWPNSESLLQYMTGQRLCNPRKLQLIGKGSSNGINIDLFNRSALDKTITAAIKETIHYDEQLQYLLFIGRLVADKGITELVKAFRNIQVKHPSIRLVLVGSTEKTLDPLPDDIIKEIETNMAIIHINWTDQVMYYLSLANYFVFPSHREGFPNVLLQAAAMEVPVICSRIAGNIDIITHEETGLIFACGDQQNLQEMIERAIGEPEKMQEMAKRLLPLIHKNFRRENTWENLRVAYKSLLN